MTVFKPLIHLLTISFFHKMASRPKSQRLQGMGPEVHLFQDKCFICLLDIDIQSIPRCHAMPCFGKFLHQRCFEKVNQTSFQCGHCLFLGDNDSNTTYSVDEPLRANEELGDSPIWQPPEELRGPTKHRKGTKCHCRSQGQCCRSHTSSSRK